MTELRIQIEGDTDDLPAKPNGNERTLEELEAESARAREATQRHLADAARYRAEGEHLRIVTALNRTDMEGHEAQSEYRSAVELGDADAQTRAQARMAEVEARRVRLLEHEQVLRNTPIAPADPVEAACAGLSERSAQWLRKHPDYAVDPRKNAKIRAAHFDAVAEGLREDTPEYFAHVERKVGLNDGSRNNGNDRGAAPKPPAPFNPSDVSTHIRNDGRVVTLTKGEKAAATDGTLLWATGPNRGKPIGVAEFARRKVQMAREGRYSQLNDLAK
jgi:hypothetical protein